MSRDDSLLNTGIASTSFGSSKVQKTVAAKREENHQKRTTLLPAGEIVSEILQKEIDNVRDIDYLKVEEMLTDEHFRAEMMARKKFLERLIALKQRFETLLRDNKKPPEGSNG